MRIVNVLIIFSLISCGKGYAKPNKNNDVDIPVDEPMSLEMVCQDVGESFERCENIEVICYRDISSNSSQCKFKDNQ